MTASRRAERRVIRAAIRWATSMKVGMELSQMGAPAYLCGPTPEANHALFKAVHLMQRGAEK